MLTTNRERAHDVLPEKQLPETAPSTSVSGEMEGETLTLNMGPQHPSTHGVLRLVLDLDGENVRRAVPHIGYLHTGMEKTMENEKWQQAIVVTDRMDYTSALNNNLAYCLSVEKLLDLEIPPRGQAIRVVMCELQRIAAHLVWLGTHALDIGAMSVFLYCFREREVIMNIIEMVSGGRLTPSYIRIGGVSMDVPYGFEERVQEFVDLMGPRIQEYEDLLQANPIWIERTVGVGKITPEMALTYGVTGANLRGSGINYDVRKAFPYTGYDNYDFEIPIGQNGDVWDRYRCRMEEMRQSLRIIQQALNRFPDGAFNSDNPKVVLPPKERVLTDMEALIHHFILVTRGFQVPAGEAYVPIESPKGELGYYVVSDGGEQPYRVRTRPACFFNLSILPEVLKGALIADSVAIIGSLDIILGEIDR
jgi:NADH-quinone oxidoreductase subunit D